MKTSSKQIAWGLIIPIVMLLLAIGNFWPYGYYILLRWVVSTFLAVGASQIYKTNPIWTGVFIFIALLFNPLVPVHLDKETWVAIDILTASLLGASIFVVKIPKES